MNSGKTLFAQLMDFLPWSTFTRIVSRYGGDWRVRTLSCAEQYRAMAFAQLTYRDRRRHRRHSLQPQADRILGGRRADSGGLRVGRDRCVPVQVEVSFEATCH